MNYNNRNRNERGNVAWTIFLAVAVLACIITGCCLSTGCSVQRQAEPVSTLDTMSDGYYYDVYMESDAYNNGEPVSSMHN